MIIVLQVVGALAALIGVVTIGIGIPVKEFSFGNTLIVAGTVGLCTGLITARPVGGGDGAAPGGAPPGRRQFPPGSGASCKTDAAGIPGAWSSRSGAR